MKKSWKHCDILPKCRLSRNVKVFYISTNRGRLVSFLFLSPLIKKKKEKKTSQNQRKTPKTKNWEIRLCSSLFSFCSDVLQLFFEKYKFHIFLVLFFQVQICFGGGKMLSFWERSPVLAYSSLSIPTAAKAFIPPCNCNVVMVSFSFFFFFGRGILNLFATLLNHLPCIIMLSFFHPSSLLPYGYSMLLLLLSRVSRVRLCATP